MPIFSKLFNEPKPTSTRWPSWIVLITSAVVYSSGWIILWKITTPKIWRSHSWWVALITHIMSYSYPQLGILANLWVLKYGLEIHPALAWFLAGYLNSVIILSALVFPRWIVKFFAIFWKCISFIVQCITNRIRCLPLIIRLPYELYANICILPSVLFLFPMDKLVTSTSGTWGIVNKCASVATVLVHGHGANPSEFVPGSVFLYGLCPADIGPIYKFGYFKGPFNTTCPSGSKTEDCALQLDRFLRKLCTQDGVNEVVLVGHSLGALVCAYFSSVYADDNPIIIRGLILLCGPFGGSDILHWLRTCHFTRWIPLLYEEILTDMMPNSIFLNELRETLHGISNTIPIYALTGGCDLLVRPHSALAIPTTDNVCLEHMGHDVCAVSGSAWIQIATWINHLLLPKVQIKSDEARIHVK